MKRVSKILVLLLVAVMLVGLFAGCGIFSRKSDVYREQIVLTVGTGAKKQEITIGKLIDTYNNYYNSYAAYISNGYITADYIFQMTMNSIYTQYIKIYDYISADGVATYQHRDRGEVFVNQEYLDDGRLEGHVDEMGYAVRYIKYVLFSTLDSMVENYIKAEYKLGDAKEETEDTSRDFIKYDDLDGAATYSEYLYKQNFVNEEMDKYISKYYEGILTDNNVTMDEYVYTEAKKDSEPVKTRIKELNDRIEGSDPITFEKLTDYQKQAVAQYEKNVKNSYGYDVQALVKRQVEDFISSTIVTKWNRNHYATIDGTAEGIADAVAKLTADKDKSVESSITDFNINDNFVTFIEGLSSDKYIYSVPRVKGEDGTLGDQKYSYVYVKNILIPFTTEQTTILSSIEKQLGTKDDMKDLYKAKMLEFASQVVADDFNSEKDDDGKYTNKVSNIFGIADGKLVINTVDTEETHDAYEAFGKYFVADRVEESDIKDLMLRFNTDTAQHSAAYDYVVRVGAVPDSYTAKWVSEFVDATNDAVIVALGLEYGEGKTYATREDAVKAITPAALANAVPGTYGIAISNYGVHVVYFSGVVEEYQFDFSPERWMDTSTPEYKLFKSYFSTQQSELLEEALKDLQKIYYKDQIVATSELAKFAKDNGFTFDFEESLKLDDEEE